MQSNVKTEGVWQWVDFMFKMELLRELEHDNTIGLQIEQLLL